MSGHKTTGDSPKKGSGESVDSLLESLLSQTREDVASDRQRLQASIRDKQEQQREMQRREEARKREEMQRQLAEETRRLKESLARRDRDPDKRVKVDTAARADATAEIEAPALATPAQRPRGAKRLWAMGVAAVVAVAGVLIVALGSDEPAPPSPSVAGASLAAKAAPAPEPPKVETPLDRANKRIAELEEALAAAIADKKKVVADKAAAETRLSEIRSQLEAAQSTISTFEAEAERRKKRWQRHVRNRDKIDVDMDAFK